MEDVDNGGDTIVLQPGHQRMIYPRNVTQSQRLQLPPSGVESH